jgi:predicted nucleic acid-binding protein
VTALDTSVIVAAFSEWHEFHVLALEACHGDPHVPAHAYMETYSVLTRMPDPFRASSLPNVDSDRVGAFGWAEVVTVRRTLELGPAGSGVPLERVATPSN